MRVINAENMVLGRLASIIAKELINNIKTYKNEEFAVVNVEKAIIIGRKEDILKKYKRLSEEIGSDRKGPYLPRRPDRLFRRTVRGMLPYQKSQGRMALKKMKAYVGIPKEFEGYELEVFKEAEYGGHRRHIELGRLCQYLKSDLKL
ncbi:MAG TPA: 50S ribosomal protein L13 [Thermoplasmata archaeon]|nr:50S ribosomal protein L13 [Thermoplasmata archaeon]